MSRHCYVEEGELDCWDMILWRGAVQSAIRGKRGQALLRELLVALDAMPEKRLIVKQLRDEGGEVCALGAVGSVRGLKLEEIDPEDYDAVAKAFGIAPALAREIEWINDENDLTPEQRWEKVRAWVAKQIKPTAAQGAAQ